MLTCRNYKTAYIAFVIAIVSSTILYFLYLWLSYEEAWLHNEQVRVGAYIWNEPNQSIPARLRIAFDWATLDSSNPFYWRELVPAHRVRPLADIALVADAVARPFIAKWLYPHPSLTPSSIIAAIGIPIFFFLFARKVLEDNISAALLTCLLLSSIGFLSVVIPDIHSGAKRLALLFLCFSLCISQYHSTNKNNIVFVGLLFTLLVGCFTDEMALGNYIVILILYLPDFLSKGNRWKLFAITSIPLIFLGIVRWVLPAFYSIVSIHGTPQFNAFGDGKKVGLIDNLLKFDFYYDGILQTSRAILSSLGVVRHSGFLELTVISSIGIVTVFAFWALLKGSENKYGLYQLVCSGLVLTANGIYLHLLDLFPPGGRILLASYAYYYHSSLSFLTLVWIAFLLREMNIRIINTASKQVFQKIYLTMCVCLIIINFQNFQLINKVVSLVHSYPYTSRDLFVTLGNIKKAEKIINPDMLQAIEFSSNYESNSIYFDSQIQELLSSDWLGSDMHKAFLHMFFTPMDIKHLCKAFFPDMELALTTVDMELASKARMIPRIEVLPTRIRANRDVWIKGSGFTPATGFNVHLNGISGSVIASGKSDQWGILPETRLVIPDVAPGIYHLVVTNDADSTAEIKIQID